MSDNGPLPAETIEALWRGAEALRQPLVAFTQRLIQSPSLPGEEAEVAGLVEEEMRVLGYDEAGIDQAGNAVGNIKATASPAAHSIMFNAHMDHVHEGDSDRWPFPPYLGTVHDGCIWGRGTADLKGSLACQVYSGALLKRLALPLRNDIYVVGVVQEEVGGLGSSALAEYLQTDYAVIGEPSHNTLALGHRGRFEIHINIVGKSVHASVPQTGINPLYTIARVLLGLRDLTFGPDPQHPGLGPTTIAPTLLSTDQSSPNVVPGECRLILDVRNTPADKPAAVLERVREVLIRSVLDGATAKAEVPVNTLTSYTGATLTSEIASAPFGIAPDDPLAQAAVSILRSALKRDVPTQLWRFATDAGHLTAKGIKVIGFGPGYEEVIHTVEERIPIDMMVEAVVGNAALALAL
jgi:putative selenium metabolism hydrolase